MVLKDGEPDDDNRKLFPTTSLQSCTRQSVWHVSHHVKGRYTNKFCKMSIDLSHSLPHEGTRRHHSKYSVNTKSCQFTILLVLYGDINTLR